jgi:hypothetical protein
MGSSSETAAAPRAADEATAVEETPKPSSAEPAARPAPKRGRWKRRLLVTLAACPVLVLALWIAIHHVPGLGGMLADTARAILGNEAVARIEDFAYDVEDWILRRTRTGTGAKAPWEVPPPTSGAPHPTAPPAPPAAPASAAPATAVPAFHLSDVGPMHDAYATPGDGVWVPLRDPRRPDETPRMLKTFLHPDRQRSWAFVAVVAVDLAHVDLHAVAGRYEPEPKTEEAKRYERKAKVPVEHHTALLAAFNGGYKSTHGRYGMKIDGVVLAPPRPLACAVAKLDDGAVRIAPWEKLADDEPRMVWYRQTPICMYDDGKPHPGLSMSSLGWGASAVSGTTVIRRSAIGIDAAGRRLYVAIGDHLTGATIGHAVRHAGAASVAQLDVNFSYPKLVTFDHRPGTGELVAVPLTPGFELDEDQYVGRRAQRDFFYLTRKEETTAR